MVAAVCVCVCVCVCVSVCMCNAWPKPRGLTLTDTHRRTQTYFKIMAGQISTLALQLHTLRMQTLEMVKKHRPLNHNNMSALGIIVFRREQGAWNDWGLQTKRSHGAILQSHFITILKAKGVHTTAEQGINFAYRLSLCSLFLSKLWFTSPGPSRGIQKTCSDSNRWFQHCLL